MLGADWVSIKQQIIPILYSCTGKEIGDRMTCSSLYDALILDDENRHLNPSPGRPTVHCEYWKELLCGHAPSKRHTIIGGIDVMFIPDAITTVQMALDKNYNEPQETTVCDTCSIEGQVKFKMVRKTIISPPLFLVLQIDGIREIAKRGRANQAVDLRVNFMGIFYHLLAVIYGDGVHFVTRLKLDANVLENAGNETPQIYHYDGMRNGVAATGRAMWQLLPGETDFPIHVPGGGGSAVACFYMQERVVQQKERL